MFDFRSISENDQRTATYLVNVPLQFTSDREQVVSAVMKGSFGTANPNLIRAVFDSLTDTELRRGDA